jgi:hypothetical protein
MKILQATYGGQDCLKEIEKNIINDTLRLRVDNNIIGDPAVGTVKYLEIKWEISGKVYEKRFAENTFCTINTLKNDRLGIFYSNNDKPETQATIKKSLETIKIAAEGKADILTCMWQPQEDNPFQEYLAWTRTYSHLNQLLQIMQLLYVAKQTGQYETVSFLEHDVLYPDDYFEFKIPKKGELLCNMNYIGMKKTGFQDRNQNDQPFHQMTMRFEAAINHCERILPNALIRNAGLIEPEWKRVNWNSKNPSIHVNHGSHFTSHFSIYSNETKSTHEYWGDIKDYEGLFG